MQHAWFYTKVGFIILSFLSIGLLKCKAFLNVRVIFGGHQFDSEPHRSPIFNRQITRFLSEIRFDFTFSTELKFKQLSLRSLI